MRCRGVLLGRPFVRYPTDSMKVVGHKTYYLKSKTGILRMNACFFLLTQNDLQSWETADDCSCIR